MRFLAKITAQLTRVAPAFASSPWWSAGQEKYIYNSMLCNVFKPTAHLTSAERTRCPVCGPAACSGTMTRGRPAPPPCTTSLSGTGECLHTCLLQTITFIVAVTGSRWRAGGCLPTTTSPGCSPASCRSPASTRYHLDSMIARAGDKPLRAKFQSAQRWPFS